MSWCGHLPFAIINWTRPWSKRGGWQERVSEASPVKIMTTSFVVEKSKGKRRASSTPKKTVSNGEEAGVSNVYDGLGIQPDQQVQFLFFSEYSLNQ